MNLLRFFVKGVGGFSLMVSEAFIVVVVATVSGMVYSLYRCRYRLSWCQSFGLSVEVSSIVESKYRGVKVSRCAVRILGVVVGEFTLLLDFKRLTENIDSLVFQCVLQESRERRLCISSE
jgi:hypothetical protein